MRIHIVSIAGVMTANIAANLIKDGHIVTGSDQDKIYPPISTILEQSNIDVNAHPITSAIDMAIIGSSYLKFERTRQEFEQIKKLNIPYISATEYIAKNIAKQNSILIAGSYGKSTTTSLISWIISNANLNPSIMIGAKNIDDFPSFTNTPSQYSIIEADESINGLDTKAKFLYYPCKYLVLTSSHWEHKDSYSTAKKNTEAFQNLINNIQKGGFVLINQAEKSNQNLIIPELIQKITYNTNRSDYYINNVDISNSHTQLQIHSPDGKFSIKTKLLGQFNFENILASFAMCHALQIDTKIIIDSIEKYSGIERRLQIIKQSNDCILVDDFAQSGPRIQAALNTIKQHFPHHQIISIFEPHASFLQHKDSIAELKESFKPSDIVLLSKLKINIDKTKRITSKDYQDIIGDKLIYQPESEGIIDYLKSNLQKKTVIINFSSGGIKNHQLLNQIKEII